MNKVYTIGYEGKEIEDFLDILDNYRVKQIIDARSHPRSRKEDFNKEKLKEKLFQKGIKYEHMPELGGLRDKDYLELMDEGEWLEAFEELKTLIDKRKSSLMCLEKNPMKCHRRFISKKLEEEGWEVIHIGEGSSWKEKPLDEF